MSGSRSDLRAPPLEMGPVFRMSSTSDIPPELLLSESRELLAADPGLLLEWGHPAGVLPPTLEALIPPDDPALRAILGALERLGEPISTGGPAGSVWVARRIVTSAGEAIRVARRSGGRSFEAERIWVEDLTHQLRNQQMVLSSVLFTLPQAEAGRSTEVSARSLELLRDALGRALSLLEAFDGIQQLGDGDPGGALEQLLPWAASLLEARARRSEAQIVVRDLPRMEESVDVVTTSHFLAAACSLALPRLSEGSTLSLEIQRIPGEAPVLHVGLDGVGEECILSIVRELDSRGYPARVALNAGGTTSIALPLPPLPSVGGSGP
jgi:hypothetical protein